jgi:hypothetical protein
MQLIFYMIQNLVLHQLKHHFKLIWLSMVPERLESLEDKELTAPMAHKLASSEETKFLPA